MTVLVLIAVLALAQPGDPAEVADLPACDFDEVADRASWKTVSEESVELRVPEAFAVDEEARFIHGGWQAPGDLPGSR